MRIGLVGTFDVENFGDCMFPELYAHLLRAEYPEAQISLYSPTPKAAKILSFDQVKALPAHAHEARMEEDIVILTGGETIGHGHSTGVYVFPTSTLSAPLRLWLSPLLAAARGKTRFVAYCVGATKIPASLAPYVGRLLSSADYVTFRDQTSLDCFPNEMGTLTCATDPMFLLSGLLEHDAWQVRAAALLPDGLGAGDYFVAHVTAAYINSGMQEWAEQIAQIARTTGKRPLLLPICHFLHDDITLEHAGRHLTKLGSAWSIQPRLINVKDTAALIAASGGYVGSSLHGAVSAVTFAKPLAVLTGGSGSKHEGTLGRAGIDGVTTGDVSQLAALFAKSARSPLEALRDAAMQSARHDFEELIAFLATPSPPRQAYRQSDVEVIMQADLAEVKGIKTRLHRFFLAALQMYDPAYVAYKRFRLRKKKNKMNVI